MVKFHFFAQLAEQAQCDSTQLDFKQGQTLQQYMSDLANVVSEPTIESLNAGATTVSINQQFAAWDDILSDGDEVGFLPPFSGG